MNPPGRRPSPRGRGRELAQLAAGSAACAARVERMSAEVVSVPAPGPISHITKIHSVTLARGRPLPYPRSPTVRRNATSLADIPLAPRRDARRARRSVRLASHAPRTARHRLHGRREPDPCPRTEGHALAARPHSHRMFARATQWVAFFVAESRTEHPTPATRPTPDRREALTVTPRFLGSASCRTSRCGYFSTHREQTTNQGRPAGTPAGHPRSAVEERPSSRV
jgi:hypothetical protein